MNKIVKNLKNTKEIIDSIRFDAHWYRRVFHTFSASFVVYYMLPNEGFFNLLKILLPIILVLSAIILEILRVSGKISGRHFFGLRMYEQKRLGSYFFFGIGVFILLMFFPQQIALPCILCACISDPILGELRRNLSKKRVIFNGFMICFIIFFISWYKADIITMITISIIGASFALIGEMKKFFWLDDDFMIQMLPAIVIFIIFLILKNYGVDIMPEPVIYPFEMIW